MQSDEQYQYDEELMDSLLKEQVRSDREQSIREIENAIMKDVVSHSFSSPPINWRQVFISGAVAAMLVLGFGYFLSLILLPGIHRGAPASAANADDEFSPHDSRPMLIRYIMKSVTGEGSQKPAHIPDSNLVADDSTANPELVFIDPTKGVDPQSLYPTDPLFVVPASDLHVEPELPIAQNRQAKLVDQEWSSPYEKPISTFSLDVENASYANIRRLIQEGAPIPSDAVRIEECVNAFDYKYAGPKNGSAFEVHTDLISCPWNGSNVLVKLAIQGANAQTAADIIAKDVRALVEFNPQRVGSYRLIGYASPSIKSEAATDASSNGDIAAGHTLTAFYEIVPARPKSRQLVNIDPLKYQRVGSNRSAVGPKDEWLTLKLQYKKPQGGAEISQEKALKGFPTHWINANTDTRFAASVVIFGMKLRGMDEVEGITWQQVAQVAEPQLIDASQKDRAEFIELINTLEASGR